MKAAETKLHAAARNLSAHTVNYFAFEEVRYYAYFYFYACMHMRQRRSAPVGA